MKLFEHEPEFELITLAECWEAAERGWDLVFDGDTKRVKGTAPSCIEESERDGN